MGEIKSKIQEVESNFEALVPSNKRARLKVLLDRFMPMSLILLGSMITFHFFIPVSESISFAVNVLNLGLVVFFALRLLLAFSLASSHKKFLRNHWFDALLVIPALAMARELRVLMFLESEAEESALMGYLFARTTMVSGQITRIYAWVRRIIKI